ncbi:hydrogenase formation protein HypD [Thermodesulfovibrio yellowstonii]|uniref:hydrogenase formation protein HypD n=1 Tax=Thermodesulfovibrio yellowstonii TaxID=28262 RepID=UPI0004280DDE|nr:hydrogenase formation protein HypD [Thermodesulfovibrio islandicus]
MKEFIGVIEKLSKKIQRQINLMEVCGTHTVSIFRHGIRSLIPSNIKLLSGPGCPVCVTPIEDVDRMLYISKQPDVILTTFGDMMRVPGSNGSLYKAKAEGADIRMVYSPLDALKIAENNKNKRIVFFAVGFETTSPLIAGTLFEADRKNIENFYIYSVHKLVPPALEVLVNTEELKLDGFILPGHVSTIIGSKVYEFIPLQYKKACVITGFDADDILHAIAMLLKQISDNEPKVEIQYKDAVKPDGNPKAIEFINRYFEPADSNWRGIGIIPKSGLKLKEKYAYRDAQKIFSISGIKAREPQGCKCGLVLIGVKLPTECPLFAKICTPENPVGACMVSSEGSCAAYYKYGRS